MAATTAFRAFLSAQLDIGIDAAGLPIGRAVDPPPRMSSATRHLRYDCASG